MRKHTGEIHHEVLDDVGSMHAYDVAAALGALCGATACEEANFARHEFLQNTGYKKVSETL